MTVKDEAKQRDGHTCVKCGHEPENGKTLHAHQIVPWSKGGPDDVENLATLCTPCEEFAPGHETVVVEDGMYSEAFSIYRDTQLPPVVDIATFGGEIREEHGSNMGVLVSAMAEEGEQIPRLSESNWWSMMAALSDHEGYRKVVADDFPVESYLKQLDEL